MIWIECFYVDTIILNSLCKIGFFPVLVMDLAAGCFLEARSVNVSSITKWTMLVLTTLSMSRINGRVKANHDHLPFCNDL